MSTIAEIKLWGNTIGAASVEDAQDVCAFEYDATFASGGIDVAPLTMPLSQRVYRFPALSRQTFFGLPGMLADSLPDKFGNALIDAWLATQGRPGSTLNAVERLCYTGTRGMGALEFEPAARHGLRQSAPLQVGELVQLASEILSKRSTLDTSFDPELTEAAIHDILRVGTSAGGARAKAVIAWNPSTNEVRSGQVAAGDGFEYWLLKFDGVDANSDKESDDPIGYGAIEYAYHLMATDAGITMADCRLFEENGRRHFMTKRFDRKPDGQKLHMQSLGAIAHFDFNMAGAYAYEQGLLTCRKLGLPMVDIEQLYRRMVFNIVARNQDDHVKNIAFLMNKRGEWSLSPAYDVTYSYNPSGAWTGIHQMTVNGKRDDFTIDDLKACAQAASMKRGRAATILREVTDAVTRWPEFAATVGLDATRRDQIHRTLRLGLSQ